MGAGLIGSRLADLARDSGWRIQILHRSGDELCAAGGVEEEADMRGFSFWVGLECVIGVRGVSSRQP